MYKPLHLKDDIDRFMCQEKTKEKDTPTLNLACVTLWGWPAKQTIPLSVLVRNQTKGFGLEISAGAEVEGDARRELVGKRSWQAVGDGTRTEAVGTGHQSGESKQHEMGSSDSEEDRVKMSRHSSCFVEFSLVTHASVSLYMLSGMQSVA